MIKNICKINLLLLSLLITLSLQSCNKSNKINVNSSDTQIIDEKNDIDKFIEDGNQFISIGHYEEAMNSYMQAIALDKNNKDLYIMLKDIYINSYRFDDAYLIIKTAISNNVDIENMKILAKEISSKFDVINLNTSIYQDDEYVLPTNINYTVNNNSTNLSIQWNSNVNTSIPGEYTYNGYNDEYGRTINMSIKILPNIYDKQIGYIKDIYKENDNIYVAIDLIEFYKGSEAIEEAIKDNKVSIDENGNYVLYSGFYIRNNYDKITTYQISNNCSFELLNYDFDSYLSVPLEIKTVDYNTFYTKVDESKQKDYSLLCWVEIKNGIAYSINRQYLP
ncbi:tetratricopeptide repeat protein [Clostridium tertium]|uniref:tetratricopeptide repeat protein n=1 Tax=Clostridium tertium TaxID=1559 RepID=UPI0024B36498|nr:tetratricopeptide repeat protein [Clostridium tertium]MDI9216949.1 tetratricopeptide repeat protein [Clostridium tertium]